ncbi:hypothetical protein ACET3Z_023355 [Daucus carota]
MQRALDPYAPDLGLANHILQDMVTRAQRRPKDQAPARPRARAPAGRRGRPPVTPVVPEEGTYYTHVDSSHLAGTSHSAGHDGAGTFEAGGWSPFIQPSTSEGGAWPQFSRLGDDEAQDDEGAVLWEQYIQIRESSCHVHSDDVHLRTTCQDAPVRPPRAAAQPSEVEDVSDHEEPSEHEQRQQPPRAAKGKGRICSYFVGIEVSSFLCDHLLPNLTSGIWVAGHLSLRVQQLDVKCETKTKDNVFVNVVASIQYRALSEKANDAFYRLTNTRSQIQAYVFDVIRGTVPKLDLDAAFEQKNDIAKAVEEELEKAMSHYGFEIVQTLIVDIEPDEHVKRAMNEINAAARLRMAATEKAEAEKILQIKRAEGEAESKYLSGVGIARQRQAIVDGLRDSVIGFSVNVPGTTAKDVMDMVLVTQYFDTMKEIGAASKSSAVFIPHGPGAVRDVAAQIRDGLLQGSSSQH